MHQSASSSLDVSPGPRGGTSVRVSQVALDPDIDLDAVLTPVRRALFGLAAVLSPERAQRESGGLALEYSVPAGTPSLVGHPPADALPVALELAHAVGQLHDRGFAHGGLDPRLVVLSVDGVRIMGAGLAEVLRAASSDDLARCLDVRFLAPELAKGGVASVSSDVYALGAILHHVLGVKDGPAHRVVAAAMSEDPRARPSDAWALRDALKLARDAPAPPPAPEAATETAPKAEPERPSSQQPEPPPEPKSPSAPLPDALPVAGPGPVPQPALVREPKSNAAWAILFIAGGGLLLLLGFGGVFAYTFTRAAPSPATAVSVASKPPVPLPAPPLPTAPPATPPPPALTPAPSAQPDAAAVPDAEAPLSPGPSKVARPPVGLVASAPLPVGTDLPMAGAPDAAVTLVIFGDLACPYTRRSLPVLRKLRTAFPSDLRVFYRHRPLPQHANAESAAHVAAGVHLDHGSEAFFRLLHTLSAAPGRASTSEMKGALKSLSIAHQSGWQTDPRVKRRLADDKQWAGLFAIRHTPTFFINGERVDGLLDYRALETAVKKERAAARSLVAQGVSASAIYAARVRKNMIGIGLDVPDRTCPTVSSQPARGADDPLVTIVEFSDFECRYCKKIAPALDQVLAKRGGDVRLVWRNFPLSSHKHARAAATLALQANKKLGHRVFWRAHDRLFDNQRDLSDPALSSIARQLGLDPAETLRAIRSDTHAATLDADIKEGVRVGVRGTPALYINGRSVAGARNAKELLRIVDEEIDWARRLTRSGTPRHRIYTAVCGG